MERIIEGQKLLPFAYVLGHDIMSFDLIGLVTYMYWLFLDSKNIIRKVLSPNIGLETF